MPSISLPLVPFWKFLHHSWNRTWVNKDSYAHRKPFTHCASLWNWWWSLVEITRSILSSKPLPYLPLGLMTNMTFDTFTGSPSVICCKLRKVYLRSRPLLRCQICTFCDLWSLQCSKSLLVWTQFNWMEDNFTPFKLWKQNVNTLKSHTE